MIVPVTTHADHGEVCEFCGNLDATLHVVMIGARTVSVECADCGGSHFNAAASPARDEIEVPF